MADKTIARLMNLKEKFYKDLKVEDILDHLASKSAIEVYEKKDILAEKTAKKRIDFLLGCLQNYGDEGFPIFINALKENNGKYDHLVKLILEGDSGIRQRKLPEIPWQATAESLANFAWYFGDFDRDKSARLLGNMGEEGSYLVRLGSNRERGCPFVLTVLARGRTWHVQIGRRSNQKYALGLEKPDENMFTSIPDMIHHFQSSDLELKDSNNATFGVKLSKCPLKSDIK